MFSVFWNCTLWFPFLSTRESKLIFHFIHVLGTSNTKLLQLRISHIHRRNINESGMHSQMWIFKFSSKPSCVSLHGFNPRNARHVCKFQYSQYALTHVSNLKMHRKLSHAENNSYEFRLKIHKKYKIFTGISMFYIHFFPIQRFGVWNGARCIMLQNHIASIDKSQRNQNSFAVLAVFRSFWISNGQHYMFIFG